jgi:anti-repressor protein
MEELVKIQEKDGNQVVSARELSEALEIKKDFTNWIKAQIESLGLVVDEDFSPFWARSEAGRNVSDYALTMETAKHISMASRTEKGRSVRNYFIACEKKLSTAMAVPQNLPEALRLAADLADKNQKLLPKAEVFDRFMDSTGVKSVGVVAKEIGLGRTRLFKLLKDYSVLMKNNIPYQQHIDAGHFVVKEIPFKMGEINNNYSQTFFTPKGEAWLVRKLIEKGLLS